MSILFRYACLIGVGLASIFAFVSATAVTGQRLASAGGYAVQDPGDMSFLVLAAIGGLGLLWLVKFVVRGVPSMMRDWYDRRKGQLATLAMACVLCLVFLVV